MRMSRDMIATAFRFTRWAILTFAMLTVMAMLLYPGGTFRDPSTQHYLFLRNFLSDLGMPTSWGGHANRLGALLFVSGEILFASALIAFSVALISLCSSSSGQRRWARAAAVAGVAAGVGFIGAALTPADRFLQLHVQSALLAFGGVFVAALFLSVILARDHKFSRSAAVVCIGMTLLLGGYMAVIEWGPRLDTEIGLFVQVAAQKAVFVAAVPSFYYLSSEAGRVAAEPGRMPEAV